MWNLFTHFCFAERNILWFGLIEIKYPRGWNLKFLSLIAILCRNVSSASFLAPSAISTLPFVVVLLINPIRLNKLLALVRFWNCSWPSTRSGYLMNELSTTAIMTSRSSKCLNHFMQTPSSKCFRHWYDDFARWSFLDFRTL